MADIDDDGENDLLLGSANYVPPTLPSRSFAGSVLVYFGRFSSGSWDITARPPAMTKPLFPQTCGKQWPKWAGWP